MSKTKNTAVRSRMSAGGMTPPLNKRQIDAIDAALLGTKNTIDIAYLETGSIAMVTTHYDAMGNGFQRTYAHFSKPAWDLFIARQYFYGKKPAALLTAGSAA